MESPRDGSTLVDRRVFKYFLNCLQCEEFASKEYGEMEDRVNIIWRGFGRSTAKKKNISR